MKKLFLTLAMIAALVAALFIVANCSTGTGLSGKLPDHSADDAVTKPSEPANPNPSEPEEPPEQSEDDGEGDEPEPPQIFTVIFVADGETVAVVTYTDGGEITEPTVPEKEGYYGKWEDYTLTGNVTVNAVYEKIYFTVVYYVNGELFSTAEIYSVDDIVYPEVPTAAFCEVVWEEPVINGYEISVNAIYMPVNYILSFVADGVTVAEVAYTVFDGEIVCPPVPDKPFYSGIWEEYDLDGGDKTVNAVYTPITYTVTFVADGNIIDTVYYDIENTMVVEPVLPEKPGYTQRWEEYSVAGGNITVNAVYTALNASEFLTYKAVSGGYKVKMYGGSESRVIVPAEYNGKPVLGVGEEAFAGTSVEEVHVCEGVQSLDYAAFYECKTLKKVLLPESLTRLAEGTFYGCSSLESINLPSGLTVIPAEAFASCGLKEINFPAALKEIRERAFYQCGELERAVFPEGLEVIGEFAFCSCVKLKSVVFGENLVRIGAGAFFNCKALEEAVFADAQGWCDEPKQMQHDLPALLQSPATAAAVLKNYGNVAFVKKD